MLDYKNFEKLNLTYSANTNEERLNNLQQLSDTLSKQVEALKLENKKLQSGSKHGDFYIFLLMLICGGLVVRMFLKGRGTRDEGWLKGKREK
jgi:hypothetical protein